MSVCLFAAVLLAATSPGEAGPTVVVVVQGDAADAGRVQASVEADLERQGIRIVRGVGPKIGPPPEAPASDVQTQKAIRLLRAAESSYASADLEGASSHLEAARAILANTLEPAASDARVTLHLWAATIALESGRTENAKQEITNLFKADPDPMVSTDVFPPEIVSYVQREKPKDVVVVTLTGVPENAVITVTNGTTTRIEREKTFGAERGARIRIRAPYSRTAEITVPAESPVTRAVQMALALSDPGESAMKAVFARAEKPHTGVLAGLATQAGADALVLVQSRGVQSRGVVVRKNGAGVASAPGDAAALTTFVVSQLRPSRGGGGAPADANGFDTRGGAVFSSWSRELDGLYSFALSGIGPAIAVEGRWNGLLAGADFSYVTYSLTPIEVEVTGGASSGTVTGEGGSALRGALDVGYERKLGPVFVAGLVGGRFEQYSMTTLEIRVQSEARPALASSTFNGAHARVRVVYPIGNSIRVSAGAGAVLAPSYTEDPAGTSGTNPEARTAPFWRLGASWETSSTTRVGIDYGGELRSTALDGPPAVDREGNADNSDLTLTEMVSSFAVTAAYRF